MLHILQHGIDLDRVHTHGGCRAICPPAGPTRHPHGRAAAGLPHRLDPLQHWCLQELAAQTDDASVISPAGLRIAETTAAYIDQVSRRARFRL